MISTKSLVKKAKELRTLHLYSGGKPSQGTLDSVKKQYGDVNIQHHLDTRLGKNQSVAQDTEGFNIIRGH